MPRDGDPRECVPTVSNKDSDEFWPPNVRIPALLPVRSATHVARYVIAIVVDVDTGVTDVSKAIGHRRRVR